MLKFLKAANKLLDNLEETDTLNVMTFDSKLESPEEYIDLEWQMKAIRKVTELLAKEYPYMKERDITSLLIAQLIGRAKKCSSQEIIMPRFANK